MARADRIEVLKMDIEGSEFDVLPHEDWTSICIGQILMELHPKPHQTLGNILEHLDHLERAGYRLFSTEHVCVGCGSQMEMSFIHKWWTPYGWIKGPCQT